MAMIKIDDVTYSYPLRDEEGKISGGREAVDSITLQIEEGDFAAVLGQNGSGKSTLAKHMNALLVPTRGTVLVDGMDTRDEEKIWDIRKSAGMVFQNPDNQIIGTVVEEDVGFGPENIGVPTEEIWKRVNGSLESVGMNEYRKMSPDKLSGGQKQRVAIAGVMAIRPKCIILDEATAMLDPVGRKEVLETARKLNRENGMTIVWITHYMEEVIEADKVFVVHNGGLAMEGTPREIFSRTEELEKLHLDAPQVTKLAAKLKARGIDLPDGILSIDEMVEAVCRLK